PRRQRRAKERYERASRTPFPFRGSGHTNAPGREVAGGVRGDDGRYGALPSVGDDATVRQRTTGRGRGVGGAVQSALRLLPATGGGGRTAPLRPGAGCLVRLPGE